MCDIWIVKKLSNVFMFDYDEILIFNYATLHFKQFIFIRPLTLI